MQQNVDGSVYFNQSWEMFKTGFGIKTCNYWLGNELIHQVTKDGQYKVRFDLQAEASGKWYWAEYSTFIVDSEETKYRLTVDGYSGNAGNALRKHKGKMFTTFDSDNDKKEQEIVQSAEEAAFGLEIVDTATLQEVARSMQKVSNGIPFLKPTKTCVPAASGSCVRDPACLCFLPDLIHN